MTIAHLKLRILRAIREAPESNNETRRLYAPEEFQRAFSEMEANGLIAQVWGLPPGRMMLTQKGHEALAALGYGREDAI